MKTYFVTINAICLYNGAFWDAAHQNKDINLRDLVECELVKIDEDNEVVLKVPEMFGCKDLVIRLLAYTGEQEFGLDSRCYASIEEFRKANLLYSRNRLVRQIGFLVESEHYDYERVPYFEKAVEQFKTAYCEYHHQKPGKEN